MLVIRLSIAQRIPVFALILAEGTVGAAILLITSSRIADSAVASPAFKPVF